MNKPKRVRCPCLPPEMLVLGAFAQLPGHKSGLVVFEREDKEGAQLLLRKLPFYVENIPVVVVFREKGTSDFLVTGDTRLFREVDPRKLVFEPVVLKQADC